jgi:hypothetical protein
MLQPKIVNVEALPGYKLQLSISMAKKLFDARPYICGDWFGRLLDAAYFKTVHVLPDGSGIEWADGQDIAPQELYETSTTV